MSYSWSSFSTDGTINNSTIAASSSAASNAIASTGFGATEISIVLTYNASATNGARVEILRSYDGSSYQATADGPYAFLIPFTANTTEHYVFTVPATIALFKVQIVNVDTGQSITAATVRVRQATN